MSEGQSREDAGAQPIAVIWSPQVRTDLRAIERETAMQVLYCVDRKDGYR
jgi:hypothetical protein